jgi:hypothetical protein
VTDLFQLYDWAARVGFPGAMALFIWASYTGRVCWGSELRARLAEMKEVYDARVQELTGERNSRVLELLAERNEFKDMVIGGQRNLAKTLDVISETSKVEPKPRAR